MKLSRSISGMAIAFAGVVLFGCDSGEPITVEGRPQNAEIRMGITSDSGQWYYIDDGVPNGWSEAQLKQRFRVEGRLFIDDRFKGIDGGPGTAGNDRIIVPDSITQVPDKAGQSTE